MRIEAGLSRILTKPSVKESPPGASDPHPVAGFQLVWKSRPLTRRDLNIPDSAGTNPTGSMGLKRGEWETGMDHRHYFRDTVFALADWEPDARGSIWERAAIIAGLKVKGIWHGMFSFKLSHNRDTTSRSYEQKNFMTQIHWGNARHLIARDDLLGRQLFLYRDDVMPDRPQYLIEID